MIIRTIGTEVSVLSPLGFLLCIFSLLIFSCEKDNQAPSCDILSPLNDEAFKIGDEIEIIVSANDQDGSLFEVKIFLNDSGMISLHEGPFIYLIPTLDLGIGSHIISAIASDNQGLKTEDAIRIYVEETTPVADFEADNLACSIGEKIVFSDKSSNLPTSWKWDFGDGKTSDLQNPTHYYENPGTYSVSLKVSNGAGQDIALKQDYIVISDGILFNPDLEYGTLTDIDGNEYRTIYIGPQNWMAENLKVTRYANGEHLLYISDALEEFPSDRKGYTFYNNDITNVPVYGNLYTWYATVNTEDINAFRIDKDELVQGICPDGWHLPSYEEWRQLTELLGDYPQLSLNEAGNAHWDSKSGYNSTGFTAVPGGHLNWKGSFYGLGTEVYMWSSSFNDQYAKYARWSTFTYDILKWDNLTFVYSDKDALSVRCLQD